MLLSKRYNDIIEQVYNDISNHHLHGHSIAQIAHQYGIERSRLIFYFKQVYGISIFEHQKRAEDIAATIAQSQNGRKQLNVIKKMKKGLSYLYSRMVKRRTNSLLYSQL